MRAYWRDGTVAVDPELKIGSPKWREQLLAFEKKLMDRSYKVLSQEVLSSGRWVSTVWLGFDASWGDGEPIIFETAVFASRDKLTMLECHQAGTEATALEWHSAMLERWRHGDPAEGSQ